ncbi:hypothetical protein V8E54_006117 [Elaphomyces granulatus]
MDLLVDFSELRTKMYEKDRMTTTAWLLLLLAVPTMSPMTVTSELRRGSRVLSHRGIVGNTANTEKETDFTSASHTQLSTSIVRHAVLVTGEGECVPVKTACRGIG